MIKLALFVRLEAKPGKEADVEIFLRGGLPIVQDELATLGSEFGLDRQPSGFSMPSRTRREGKLTSPEGSRQR
jgi:hypothetical protein